MSRLPFHQTDPGDVADGTYGLVVADGVVEGLAQTATAGYREVLMASGTTFPAEPLESSDGGDWLYGEAP